MVVSGYNIWIDIWIDICRFNLDPFPFSSFLLFAARTRFSTEGCGYIYLRVPALQSLFSAKDYFGLAFENVCIISLHV